MINSETSSKAELKIYRRWLFVLLIIIGIVFLIWLYSRPKPINVEIATVAQGLVEHTVANTRAGTVKACRRAKLSPSIGGQITQLPIKEGDSVKQGQLLLSLWNEDLQAQVALAQNEILSARSQANSICQQAQFSEREAQRLKKLQLKKAISEEQLDDAVTLAKMHASNCQSAKSSIKTKISQENFAKAALDRTRLVAPFDGIIADISAELSEYVTPSPVGVQTLPVVDLIDNNCFYVAAPIDEVDAPAVNAGMIARITLDAFGDEFFQGRVRRVAAFVLDLEKQARTVDVEVEFIHPEDHQKLLAGYSADVEVIIQSKPQVLRIPTEAVISNSTDNSTDNNANEKNVWLYQPETKTIASRTIKTGLSNWNFTEVLAGLEAGEKIILSIDREGLAESALVEVTEK